VAVIGEYNGNSPYYRSTLAGPIGQLPLVSCHWSAAIGQLGSVIIVTIVTSLLSLFLFSISSSKLGFIFVIIIILVLNIVIIIIIIINNPFIDTYLSCLARVQQFLSNNFILLNYVFFKYTLG